MKVLMISSDSKILEPNSDAALRLKQYEALTDGIYPVLIAGRWNIGAFWRAYRDGVAIVKAQSRENMIISAQDPSERWIVGCLLSWRFSLPLHLQIHTDILSPWYSGESLRNTMRRFIATTILPRATSVRVVSERIKRSLMDISHLKNLTIDVLPIHVDVAQLLACDPPRSPEFDFIFLMVSRLTREKNIPVAIEAFKTVVSAHPQTRLRIVGDGPERDSLYIISKKLELENHIEFMGWQENKTTIYQGAHTYLLTSNYEGYGRTVVEAMAMGLPVIMTDVGLAGGVLIHEESGLVVPVSDKNALSRAMIRVIEDTSLREHLGQTGRDTVRSFISEDEYFKQYQRLWDECLSAWRTRKK